MNVKPATLSRPQLERLLQILLATRGDACPTATQLADLCEVSTRTIYRDLNTLDLAGVPIRFSPCRRGYMLAPGFNLATPPVDDQEMQSLILIVAASRLAGLQSSGWVAILKLIESLSDPQRLRARRLAGRVIVDRSEGSPPPQPSMLVPPPLAALAEAVAHQVEVVVEWTATGLRHDLAPCSLYLAGNAGWLVLGRLGEDPTIRAIPLSQLAAVELTERPFELPDGFQPSLEAAKLRSRRTTTRESITPAPLLPAPIPSSSL